MNRRQLLELGATVPLALCFASACLKQKKSESYGLETVHLRMAPSELARLNSSVWEKTPVAGAVEISGKKHPARVNYAGKSTIDAYKKSFDLALSDDARLFGMREIRLSAQATDPSGLRSLVGFPAFALAGLDAPRVEPVSLYLNSEFQGLYLAIEPVDAAFFERRGKSVQSLYKAQLGNTTFKREMLSNFSQAINVKISDGGFEDLKHLVELANAAADEATRTELVRCVDVDSLLRYLAVSVLLDNWDGFENNFFLWRAPNDAAFRAVPWDLDRIYDDFEGRGKYQTGNSLYGSNQLNAQLLAYPELKKRYLTILRELALGPLSRDALTAEIDKAATRIAKAYAADAVLTAKGSTAASEAEALKSLVTKWYAALTSELATLPTD